MHIILVLASFSLANLQNAGFVLFVVAKPFALYINTDCEHFIGSLSL